MLDFPPAFCYTHDMSTKSKKNKYCITLVTRLKRRVFLSKNIPAEIIQIADQTFLQNGVTRTGYRFSENTITIEVETDSVNNCVYVSSILRRESSGVIRYMFPELWHLPSLWNKDVLITNGEYDESTEKAIRLKLDSLRAR